MDEAVSVCDTIAPEHLEVQVADSDAVWKRISNYGGMFIGANSAGALQIAVQWAVQGPVQGALQGTGSADDAGGYRRRTMGRGLMLKR
jgi:hypothetical protein